jgi:hypothetical protein
LGDGIRLGNRWAAVQGNWGSVVRRQAVRDGRWPVNAGDRDVVRLPTDAAHGDDIVMTVSACWRARWGTTTGAATRTAPTAMESTEWSAVPLTWTMGSTSNASSAGGLGGHPAKGWMCDKHGSLGAVCVRPDVARQSGTALESVALM